MSKLSRGTIRLAIECIEKEQVNLLKISTSSNEFVELIREKMVELYKTSLEELNQALQEFQE